MAKILKQITFCRRTKSVGIYTGNVKVKGQNRVIRLVDRDLITPTDPGIIKFLSDDPEIEIYCTDEKEQKEENSRNDEKEQKEENSRNDEKDK